MSDALAGLQQVATGIGATEIAEDIRVLAARLAKGLFYVACVGQFKRGKSTLLNALVGDALLPTGVAPVTAVITVVRYGDARNAVVRFDDGRFESIEASTVADYVTEERNPENRKRVRVVEVSTPSELLASGMCLVDTPGLGSIFRQNTETTRAFLPHIDAALVVLGADPPVSGEEAAVVEEISRDVKHIIFVLNKADRLSDREVGEAATFTRTALQNKLGRDVRLLTISAVERLNGLRTRNWPELQDALTALARDAGADLVREAQQRGQRRIASRLQQEIVIQRETLTRPIEESEARLAELKRTIDDARRALSDLAFLFTAEEHRLSREFDDERNRFLTETLARAGAELDESIERMNATRGRLREAAFEGAEAIAARVVKQWLERIEPRAEDLYSSAMERFVSLAQDFLLRVDAINTSAGAEELAEQRFRKRRGFFFTGLWMLTGRPPGAFVVDMFRSAAQQRERARGDAHVYLRRLFETNAARVANDLRERVLESRRMLEGEVRRVLDRAATSAERALERARASHAAGTSTVENEIARLDHARRKVGEVTSTGPRSR